MAPPRAPVVPSAPIAGIPTARKVANAVTAPTEAIVPASMGAVEAPASRKTTVAALIAKAVAKPVAKLPAKAAAPLAKAPEKKRR